MWKVDFEGTSSKYKLALQEVRDGDNLQIVTVWLFGGSQLQGKPFLFLLAIFSGGAQTKRKSKAATRGVALLHPPPVAQLAVHCCDAGARSGGHASGESK